MSHTLNVKAISTWAYRKKSVKISLSVPRITISIQILKSVKAHLLACRMNTLNLNLGPVSQIPIVVLIRHLIRLIGSAKISYTRQVLNHLTWYMQMTSLNTLINTKKWNHQIQMLGIVLPPILIITSTWKSVLLAQSSTLTST